MFHVLVYSLKKIFLSKHASVCFGFMYISRLLVLQWKIKKLAEGKQCQQKKFKRKWKTKRNQPKAHSLDLCGMHFRLNLCVYVMLILIRLLICVCVFFFSFLCVCLWDLFFILFVFSFSLAICVIFVSVSLSELISTLISRWNYYWVSSFFPKFDWNFVYVFSSLHIHI